MTIQKKVTKGSIFQISRTDLLFIFTFILFCVSNFFELTVWFFVDDKPGLLFASCLKLIRYFSYFCCVLKLIFDIYYSHSYVFYSVAVAGILVLNTLASGNRRMIFYFLLILAARDVSADVIIRTFLCVYFSLMIVTVLAASVGIIEDTVQDLERNRHYLGFTWTTHGPMIFLFCSFCYIYLKKGFINIIETLLMLLGSFYFFKMTNSRFIFLISVGSIMFFWIFKSNRFINTVTALFKRLILLSPFLIAFFSIMLHALYNPESGFWTKLNDMLSNRLALGKNAIVEYGLSLFGKPIIWKAWEYKVETVDDYNYVDCSYLNILLLNGLLFLLVVLVAYWFIMKKAYDSRNYHLVWICFFILVLSITEPRLVHLSYNPFILLVLTKMMNLSNVKVNNDWNRLSVSMYGYKHRYIL